MPTPRRARFEREAKTVSSLNHPNICTLHDVGREGDTDFLVMELIEGETLASRLAKGPLPGPEVLKLGVQVADALDRADERSDLWALGCVLYEITASPSRVAPA